MTETNYATERGAAMLKARIDLYWRNRGYDVSCRVDRVSEFHYGIRSNIGMSMPKKLPEGEVA